MATIKITQAIRKDALRNLRVFNDWEFSKKSGLDPVPPFISYVPQSTGRGVFSSRWQVIRPGFQTDKDAHWSDNGRKTFTLPYGDQGTTAEKRAFALAEAKEWAEKRYGVTHWLRSPFGAWHPADVVDRWEARIRELIAA